MISEEDYNAAKQRQEDNPGAFGADDPSPEVLADVETIRSWERALNQSPEE